jgi:hypothetical protein
MMDGNEYWQAVLPLFKQIKGITLIYLAHQPDTEELLDVIEKIRVATKDIVEPIIKFSENPGKTTLN